MLKRNYMLTFRMTTLSNYTVIGPNLLAHRTWCLIVWPIWGVPEKHENALKDDAKLEHISSNSNDKAGRRWKFISLPGGQIFRWLGLNDCCAQSAPICQIRMTKIVFCVFPTPSIKRFCSFCITSNSKGSWLTVFDENHSHGLVFCFNDLF